ncbi:MAG: hypothetical protein AAGA03_07815 [Planctomycetota bacterium]
MSSRSPESGGPSPIDSGQSAPFAKPPTDHAIGTTPSDSGSSLMEMAQNKLVVLGILFGVTGFLGLPLLWMNKQFTQTERILWAILNTIYTCGLIALAVAVCMWSYRQIMGS